MNRTGRPKRCIIGGWRWKDNEIESGLLFELFAFCQKQEMKKNEQQTICPNPKTQLI
jgi:hypothetical protein